MPFAVGRLVEVSYEGVLQSARGNPIGVEWRVWLLALPLKRQTRPQRPVEQADVDASPIHREPLQEARRVRRHVVGTSPDGEAIGELPRLELS